MRKLRRTMPAGFGYFTLQTHGSPSLVAATVARLIAKARRQVAHVDCVVLPELALTPVQYAAVKREVLKRKAILIAGVGSSGRFGAPGSNMVR